MPEPRGEGPQPFVHLQSTSSSVLPGVSAETQSWWSWDPRKEFGGSLYLEMGRYSMMLWVFHVGSSWFPGMPLYPEVEGEGSCLRGASRGGGGDAGSCCSLGLSLIPHCCPGDRRSGWTRFQCYGTFSLSCLLWSCKEESAVVSGRLDVICELPNQKPDPREQK